MLEMLTQFDEKNYEEGLREEGRAEERANTEKERLRADEAEKRAEATREKLSKHHETGCSILSRNLHEKIYYTKVGNLME